MDLYYARTALQEGKSIYDLPLRVTFYARVSTEKDEQAHSLKNQVGYYSGFIQNNPNWTYAEGYIDEGLSGTSVGKRESFLKMIDDARAGKFDFIVTKEISRFSRNTLDSIQYTQELLRYGVGVLFQSDNINTLLPDAELRLTIMSSIAQDEVRKISERVKFGFKRAIEKRTVLGNGKIWGYTKRDGKLMVDERQAEIVRMIFDLYVNQNKGIRGISAALEGKGYVNSQGNPFSFSTIKNILVNPKYKGWYCGNKTSKLDYRRNDRKNIPMEDWVLEPDGENVPAIVSEDIWNRANAILTKRSAKMSSDDKTSYQNKYAYSGKVICAKHNVPYYRAIYRYASGDKEVWQCKRYAEKGRQGCDSPTIYTTELNMVMKQCYDKIIQNKGDIVHDLVKVYLSLLQKSSIKEDIAHLSAEVNNRLSRKDKLLDLSLKGKLSDDEFESRNEKFNDEMRELKDKIKTLEAEERTNMEVQRSAETLRQMIAKEINFEDGRMDSTLIGSMLDCIEVYKTDMKNAIDIKVHLKLMDERLGFSICRSRSNTSVCYKQYI